MYQALYRKWRPQTFDQVVGQEHVTETLKSQVKSGRLSHSYIFIGTRGTGKTTCARILAKAVNCHSPLDGNPCGKCPACLGIADGSVLDIVEIDAASNNKVDDVRALREEAVFSPASVKKRVYIIDEVHMLSNSAFNALLKILEEPPEHLMFILATTELQKVPATILSRCQRHSFHRIDSARIASYLEYIAGEEGLRISHEAAELIARLAEGGVRDALSLLDQCSSKNDIDEDAVYSAMGLAGKRRVTAMLENILRHDSAQALTEFSQLWMEGRDGPSFLKELSELLRDILMLRVAPKRGALLTSGGFELKTLKAFAARMENEELISAMETLQRYLEMLREAKNPKTVVELCLISLCDDTAGESVSALKARIARLEARLDAGDFAAPVSYRAQPLYTEEHLEDCYDRDSGPQEEAPQWLHDEPRTFPREEVPVPEDTADAVTAPVEDIATQENENLSPVQDEPSSAALSASWEDICKLVAPELPINLRAFLEDVSKLRGYMENDVLNIQAAPGFVYGRFNRQEILNCFAQAASRLCGRPVRALLGEIKADSGAQRNIEELKAFSEVRFI